jgi:RNA polymerase sigma-70 factor (ECF subfamily)
MADDEDLDAVRAVLAGDVSGFQRIVERWQGPLVNLAYRFCRDRVLAADMAQDAFLRVFRALPTFRAKSSFSTWMLSVATNVYRSQLRRNLPELAGLDALADIPALSEAQVPTSGSREELVRRAVHALPSKYRDAIVLFYFHEMNVNRASESLGVPPGTLKARLHRARGLLERRLRHLFNSDTVPTEA